MRRVLITGGAGFIGCHLATKLKEHYEVFIIDNLSNSKSASNLDLLKKNNIKFYKEDVRNKESISKIIREGEVDSCVHLAAKISVPESMVDPYSTMEVNIGGTLNLLEACARNSVERLVFASSAAVYGHATTVPIPEDIPLKPISPYGTSKVAAEEVFNSFADLGLFDSAIVLRFFNVYGSCQSDEYAGVITRFKSRVLQNLPPLIFGDGNQQRDFVSVQDIVESIKCALEPPASITNGVYNIGTGIPTSISELSMLIARILNQKSCPLFLEKSKGDIQISYADIKRARYDLGFNPKIDLVNGLQELLSNA